MARVAGLGLRAALLAFLCLAAASCASSLSNLPPYNQFAGRTVTLLEPMALVRQSGYNPYSDIILVRPSELEPLPSDWRIVGNLPVGTPVTITSVKWIKTDNTGGWILAVGVVASSGEFAGKKFTYFWGDETLNRAPWEDRSVPAERDAGRRGRGYKP